MNRRPSRSHLAGIPASRGRGPLSERVEMLRSRAALGAQIGNSPASDRDGRRVLTRHGTETGAPFDTGGGNCLQWIARFPVPGKHAVLDSLAVPNTAAREPS